jgi:beta-lactamase superfamily II metal-dependent hydrolase
MRIHIFDVEHGECSAIETPSGDLILIGLGHNSSTGWRPSAWVRAQGKSVARAVLTNLDRDHLSDIASFEPYLRPATIKTNHHVDPAWIRTLKLQESGIVDPAVNIALQWMANVYTGGGVQPAYGMELQHHYNSPAQFQDTNNLSVVTFVRYNGIGVLFPGDLETAGWKALLGNQAFITCLTQTNLLVASHHGRAGGYCADIFQYCAPHAVIISDKQIVHDTQDHDLYGRHCTGLNFSGNIRKVLTTRNDGKITIDIPPLGNYTVTLSGPPQPWIMPSLPRAS